MPAKLVVPSIFPLGVPITAGLLPTSGPRRPVDIGPELDPDPEGTPPALTSSRPELTFTFEFELAFAFAFPSFGFTFPSDLAVPSTSPFPPNPTRTESQRHSQTPTPDILIGPTMSVQFDWMSLILWGEKGSAGVGWTAGLELDIVGVVGLELDVIGVAVRVG